MKECVREFLDTKKYQRKMEIKIKATIEFIDRRIESNLCRIDRALDIEDWNRISETRIAFIERTKKETEELKEQREIYERALKKLDKCFLELFR